MIEIYTKEDCSFCSKAKRLLRDRQIPFIEHKLNRDFTREALLEKYKTVKTYPVVVIDGFAIGGFTELQEHVKVNETQQLLNEGM